MSINLSKIVPAVQAEVSKCRKALVGPVAVLSAFAAAGGFTGRTSDVVAAVLSVASYLGIRQVSNKQA